VKAARGLRNVWVDTSGGAPEAGLVEYAVEQVGADRVLYGSDGPIRDLPVAIARVTGAAIAEEAKRAILHDNARALLRLP
jgi:predicted TIM-barrel fold metal-dependent hydrolase